MGIESEVPVPGPLMGPPAARAVARVPFPKFICGTPPRTLYDTLMVLYRVRAA